MNVAILFGGQSSEHSVSCVSARNLVSILQNENYAIFPVYITPAGEWTEARPEEILSGASPSGPRLTLYPGGGGNFIEVASGKSMFEADVIFPMLHGLYGEDGTVQGYLETAQAPYTGSGILGSACAMDKVVTKKLASIEGVPVADYRVVEAGAASEVPNIETLGLPVFVKAARGGSSIGVYKVSTWESLGEAIEMASHYDSKILIETEVHGPEVMVGVLENPDGSLRVSAPGMIVPSVHAQSDFYDYEAKYNVDHEVQVPAPLQSEMIETLERFALTTFRALGCTGIARVDFFITEDGPVLNEVNTMSGLRDAFPKMWEEAGISFVEVLKTLFGSARLGGGR